jgi:hypothetical protein
MLAAPSAQPFQRLPIPPAFAAAAPASPAKRQLILDGPDTASPDQQRGQQQGARQEAVGSVPPMLSTFRPSQGLRQQLQALTREAPEALMEALCGLTAAAMKQAELQQLQLEGGWAGGCQHVCLRASAGAGGRGGGILALAVRIASFACGLGCLVERRTSDARASLPRCAGGGEPLDLVAAAQREGLTADAEPGKLLADKQKVG